jgi:hypothetical protein
MSRTRFIAAVTLVVLLVGGLIASTTSGFESYKAAPKQHVAAAVPTPSKSVTYLTDLPVSMMSIDTNKGIYYLGVGSGILTSWNYGIKSVSRDGTLNQEFVIYLDAGQFKEFQGMGGNVGPITEAQAEDLSYYAVIYSQRLIISELEAGRHKPNITFSTVIRP